MKYAFQLKRKTVIELKRGDTVLVFNDKVEDDAALGHIVTFLATWTGNPQFNHDLQILVRKYQEPVATLPFPTMLPCAKCDQPIVLKTDPYVRDGESFYHKVCPWTTHDEEDVP